MHFNMSLSNFFAGSSMIGKQIKYFYNGSVRLSISRMFPPQKLTAYCSDQKNTIYSTRKSDKRKKDKKKKKTKRTKSDEKKKKKRDIHQNKSLCTAAGKSLKKTYLFGDGTYKSYF